MLRNVAHDPKNLLSSHFLGPIGILGEELGLDDALLSFKETEASFNPLCASHGPQFFDAFPRCDRDRSRISGRPFLLTESLHGGL